MSVFTEVMDQVFPPAAFSRFPTCVCPCVSKQNNNETWNQHGLGVLDSTLPLLFLRLCSDPRAWVLFPAREALRWMKGLGTHGELAFCSLSTVRGYSGKQHQKKTSAWDELKLDKMWWGINVKKKEKKKKRKKGKRSLSLPEGALFWKLPQIITLSTFGSLQEALHCYLEPKRFLSHYEELR